MKRHLMDDGMCVWHRAVFKWQTGVGWFVTEPYVIEVVIYGKLTSSKWCFAFILTDVPAVQHN